MTPKQNKQFNLMASTLRQIARGFQTTSQLRRNSMKDWGLSYDEALEMAYENIQEIILAIFLKNIFVFNEFAARIHFRYFIDI